MTTQDYFSSKFALSPNANVWEDGASENRLPDLDSETWSFKGSGKSIRSKDGDEDVAAKEAPACLACQESYPSSRNEGEAGRKETESVSPLPCARRGGAWIASMSDMGMRLDRMASWISVSVTDDSSALHDVEASAPAAAPQARTVVVTTMSEHVPLRLAAVEGNIEIWRDDDKAAADLEEESSANSTSTWDDRSSWASMRRATLSADARVGFGFLSGANRGLESCRSVVPDDRQLCEPLATTLAGSEGLRILSTCAKAVLAMFPWFIRDFIKPSLRSGTATQVAVAIGNSRKIRELLASGEFGQVLTLGVGLETRMFSPENKDAADIAIAAAGGLEVFEVDLPPMMRYRQLALAAAARPAEKGQNTDKTSRKRRKIMASQSEDLLTRLADPHPLSDSRSSARSGSPLSRMFRMFSWSWSGSSIGPDSEGATQRGAAAGSKRVVGGHEALLGEIEGGGAGLFLGTKRAGIAADLNHPEALVAGLRAAGFKTSGVKTVVVAEWVLGWLDEEERSRELLTALAKLTPYGSYLVASLFNQAALTGPLSTATRSVWATAGIGMFRWGTDDPAALLRSAGWELEEARDVFQLKRDQARLPWVVAQLLAARPVQGKRIQSNVLRPYIVWARNVGRDPEERPGPGLQVS